MNSVKNRSELLLSLLFAGEDGSGAKFNSSIVGITRLEKLLFLLSVEADLLKDVSKKDRFNFVPFKMGPWTQEVYDEIDFLESLGLAQKKAKKDRVSEDIVHQEQLFSEAILDKYQKDSLPPSEDTEIYEITEKGKKKALEIWNNFPEKEKKVILGLKRKFNSLNLRQFLQYVYRKYPEYATRSEIKDYLGV